MDNIIPYAQQSITEEDIAEVVKVLRSSVITQGPKTDEFENKVARKVNCEYSVAVNSATSALHLACLALEVKAGDWVWTTSISFVASANCAIYCGAQIDFVDVDKATGLISIEELEKKLEISSRKGLLPKVIIAVHLGGTSCDMKSIKILSQKYGFSIVEDASHAIGGKYMGSYVGCCEFSDISVFSFHPVKIITTGEGGMLLTNNKELALKIEKLRGHGIVRKGFIKESPGPWYYEQQELGYNYRMNEIEAGLGVSQLKRLDEFVDKRQGLMKYYRKAIKSLEGIEILEQPVNTYSAYHLAIIRILDSTPERHLKLFEWMRSKSIWVQLHYWPIHLQLYYQKRIGKLDYLPNSEEYSYSCFSIPLYPSLNNYQQDYIVDTLRTGLEGKLKRIQ